MHKIMVTAKKCGLKFPAKQQQLMVMKGSHLLVISCLLIAMSMCGHVQWHEWEDHHMAGVKQWKAIQPASDTQQITFFIGLHMRNTHRFTDLIMSVSDPTSASYGKYLTQEEVYEFTTPTKENIKIVEQWLQTDSHVNVTPRNNGAFLQVTLTVLDAIRLFSVSDTKPIEFYEFEHSRTGQRIVRTAQAITIPSNIHKLVQLFANLNDFPYIPRHINNNNNNVEGKGRANGDDSDVTISVTGGNSIVSVGVYFQNAKNYTSATILLTQDANNFTQVIYVNQSAINPTDGSYSTRVNFEDLANYVEVVVEVVPTFSSSAGGGIGATIVYGSTVYPSAWITPDVTNRLYSIPPTAASTNSSNSQSVAEFVGQFYSPSDLNTFSNIMGLPTPTVNVVGKNYPNVPGGESQLDIEWITAIGRGVNTTFWYVEGKFSLLQWAIEVSEATSPPLVHSISYGSPEALSLPSQLDRINQEFQLLGARGISIISTSGDLGTSDGTKVCGVDVPDFPSSSPWTTSLGATYVFTQASSPLCLGNYFANGIPIKCAPLGEFPCSADTGAGFTTGGGFSRRYARQPYQEDAVQQYLNTASLPPASYFNASGRGFNDVAALGSNILIYRNNEIQITGGTSASGPIFAGIIALLNDVQLNANKPPLGFLNPWLYQTSAKNVGAFNQVVSGDNKCRELLANGALDCCATGFEAQVGWNPLTGLGTPNYSALKDSLP